MHNNDYERIRRSNRILIGLAILTILFGIVSRIISGDNKLYIFGFSIDLPFGQQETTEEKPEENEAPDSNARALLRAVEEAIG